MWDILKKIRTTFIVSSIATIGLTILAFTPKSIEKREHIETCESIEHYGGYYYYDIDENTYIAKYEWQLPNYCDVADNDILIK